MASLDLRQPSLFDECPVAAAVTQLADSGAERRGAVFTRREVVDFILDLVGYTAVKPLHTWRLLEPSFGDGDFLLPVIERLLEAWLQQQSSSSHSLEELSDSIRAVELHSATFLKTRQQVVSLLVSRRINATDADYLAGRWLIHGDFLLASIPGEFNVVVGNPPYVRQEAVPNALMAEYRSRYKTIYDRADLYIPFIERSLSTLRKGGRLGFICADRWMKNRYGGPLRKYVADDFHLKIYVDMVDTPAFHSDVDAYPAITIIHRGPGGATRVARRPQIEPQALSQLAATLCDGSVSPNSSDVIEIAAVVAGDAPWILESPDQMSLVRRLEATYPALEEVGCKVGIGVATGADKAFIGPFSELDVEADRKLPLVMTRDIQSGEVKWRGFGVINPFRPDGGLVDLREYPKLESFLNRHKHAIIRRHVAQRDPANWYRTIDRIYPELAARPKLLIPDIKGEAHVVFEHGQLYPHHNLYFVTSEEWDLRALQGLLLSDVARLFVSIYSTKMRGGYLRFQAQYLRKIRIPRWTETPAHLRESLIAAAQTLDISACNQAAFALYCLTEQERAAIGGNGE